MWYSLINVAKENNGIIEGYWQQDHFGTLESAKKLAKETEEINSNKIKIAVVSYLNCSVAILSYWTNLENLI